jgi:hypothetical protein
VRVILTGRPSDAIDTAESFFEDNTPVLTVRQMTPEQLVEFAGKVRAGVSGSPLKRYSSNPVSRSSGYHSWHSSPSVSSPIPDRTAIASLRIQPLCFDG